MRRKFQTYEIWLNPEDVIGFFLVWMVSHSYPILRYDTVSSYYQDHCYFAIPK